MLENYCSDAKAQAVVPAEMIMCLAFGVFGVGYVIYDGGGG
jgi:hypothetical protein